MTAPQLALVVPCHNEAARLDPEAFLRFASAHPEVQLLFVDDGSEDSTREILERMRAAARSAITVLHHAPCRGKGEAVRAGILAAISLNAPLVGFVDADLSTPLRAIDDFLAVLRQRPDVELVLGSRVMLLGRDIRRRALRHYVGRMFATFASLALDLPVYDTQCGAKVLRVNDATATLFVEPFRSRWVFDVELIARYLRLPVNPGEPARRDRLYELVVRAWHDAPGSKVRWHHVPSEVWDLARVWLERVIDVRRHGVPPHDRAARAGAGAVHAAPSRAGHEEGRGRAGPPPTGDGGGTGSVPQPPPRPGGDTEAGLGIDGRPDLPDLRRFSHEAMATVFEVYCQHPDERYAAQAAQAAFDLVDRLERDLSRFRPNSDVGRINQLPAGASTRVSPSTLECLAIACHLFDLTGGAFDVSIGTGLPSLELDADNLLVRSTRDGVRIDLGGIGKGFAVDRMAELLEEWGAVRALLHGGFSSVLALEPPAGHEGWPLTLSDPGAPSRVLARLSVRQTALGASGLRKGDHIVDPRTGGPARGRRAAWAAVPRPEPTAAQPPAEAEPRVAAAVTDGLTTAFMLMGDEEVEALCDRSPGLEAWVLTESVPGPLAETRLLHFGRRVG